MIEILLVFLFVLVIGVFYSKKIYKDEKFQINHSPCLKKLETKCYNDPQTNAKCWATKAFPCPKDNGSYMQCTNNFKRYANIADCLERSYYYSSKDERLSETCVYGKNRPVSPSGKDIGKVYSSEKPKWEMNGSIFPFAVQKLEDTHIPSIFPRVNTWRNKDLPNGFLVQ